MSSDNNMGFDMEVIFKMIELRNELQQRSVDPTPNLSAWALTANTKLKLLLESDDLHEDTRAEVEATRKELVRAVLGIKEGGA